jgi:ParB-like chromosome segregation protein Spo0J
VHNIHPDLVTLACPVKDLKALSGNPRKGDVESVAKSLEKFGQRKPVVAQVSTREVTAGNHTLLAAKRLGWDQVAVVWVEEDDASAKAFSLADNRTAQLGGYDNELLLNMIQEVMAEDADLIAAASFDDDDVDELLKSLEPKDVDPEEKSRPATITLNERFTIGPFTVLNSREGVWQERKRAWIDLGIESELGREDKPITWNMSAPPGHGHGPEPLVSKEKQ